jgi:hypothetical protein
MRLFVCLINTEWKVSQADVGAFGDKDTTGEANIRPHWTWPTVTWWLM